MPLLIKEEAVKRFIYQVMIPKVETGQLSQADYKTRQLLQVHGDVRSNTKWSASPVLLMPKSLAEVFVNGQTMGRGHGQISVADNCNAVGVEA